MPYIGRAATNTGNVRYLDNIASGFDGSDVTFTAQVGGVSITPDQENVRIYLDGVFQHPGSGNAYTISGSTITFTEAPVANTVFSAYVVGAGSYLDDKAVTSAKLDDDAVVAAKLDDDGTGFQVGDLGVGGSLTSGDKLTVTGRLRASGGIIGDITGDVTGNVTGNTSGTAATVTGAAQSNITSVGTLTGLTVSGSSAPQLTIGGTTPTIYLGDSGAEDTKLVFRGNATDVYLALDDSVDKLLIGQGTTVGGDTRITIDPANGDTTFAGTITSGTHLIDGVSNYTGLEVKGSGGSRPQIQWSNANNGDLGVIYATEGQALIIGTGNSNTTALTLDSSQNATFAGTASFVGMVTSSMSGTGFRTIHASTTSKHTSLAYDGLYTAGAQHQYIESAQDIKFYPGGALNVTFADDGAVSINANSNNKASLNVIASGTGQAPNDAKVYSEKNSSNDWGFKANAGGDDYGYSTNGAGNHALYVTNYNASGAATFRVEYDGDIFAANTSIASISDRRLKKEITNASSQWDDIKALNFVNYKWKKSTGMDDSIKYLGLVADEVESVSPGLIKIDAQPKEDIEAGVEDPEYKTVKYSIVWMKAVKALQEAMAKIETLEAKVTALENA